MGQNSAAASVEGSVGARKRLAALDACSSGQCWAPEWAAWARGVCESGAAGGQVRPKGARHDRAAAAAAAAAQTAEDAAFDRARRELVFEAKAQARATLRPSAHVLSNAAAGPPMPCACRGTGMGISWAQLPVPTCCPHGWAGMGHALVHAWVPCDRHAATAALQHPCVRAGAARAQGAPACRLGHACGEPVVCRPGRRAHAHGRGAGGRGSGAAGGGGGGAAAAHARGARRRRSRRRLWSGRRGRRACGRACGRLRRAPREAAAAGRRRAVRCAPHGA